MVYAADPWSVMTDSVRKRCKSNDVSTAISFVQQAREYFLAAERASTIETKPVLYYYSFLNLTKAAGLADRRQGLVGFVHHGLSHPFSPNERLTGAILNTGSYVRKGQTNVYGLLSELLTGNNQTQNPTLQVANLLPQSVIGHRLWCEATRAHRRERLISVADISLLEDPDRKEIWSRVEIASESLQRLGRSRSNVANESGLSPGWRPVSGGITLDGREVSRFEQINPLKYSHRAADEIVSLVEQLKPHLHRTILSSSPYRRYYLYLSPPGDTRLHQLLVVYSLMFFLGSLTRYRPTYLIEVLNGDFGGFIREFLATQPLQFVYSIASELAQREVTRAEVV